MTLDEPMVPLPEKGRVFRSGRRVRLSDVTPSGRLRLDACARYLQDIGNDDTADSGFDDSSGAWVVRRAVVDVTQAPRWREWLDLATWCGGTGRRWAERRLSMTGERGGAVEMSTLWVHLDLETMMPARLPEAFMQIYAEAAEGRRVSSRLWLDPPGRDAEGDDAHGEDAGGAAGPTGGYQRLTWPTRATDYDVMRHLNNAAYWAAVEEVLARYPVPTPDRPVRAVLEYGQGIALDGGSEDVELLVSPKPEHADVWFRLGDAVHASARLIERPGEQLDRSG